MAYFPRFWVKEPRTEERAISVVDACYDRGSIFLAFFFLNDGLLGPNSSETNHFLVCMILVVYLEGHGIFHPEVAVLFFLQEKIVFGGEVS